jgi:hypothetical protein
MRVPRQPPSRECRGRRSSRMRIFGSCTPCEQAGRMKCADEWRKMLIGSVSRSPMSPPER